MNSIENISIVICTHNGKLLLEKSLPYLALQQIDGLDVELILVDNNSTDGTSSYVEKKWSELGSPFPLILLKEEKLGKFNASITGFNAAKYENILVCDDDNMLCADYCVNALSILKNHPGVGVVGGFGIPEFESDAPEWFEEYKAIFACGPQAPKTGVIIDSSINIWGAGMVFRKSIWTTINKDLGYTFFLNELRTQNISSGGDDSELSELAKWLGYSLYFDEGITYKHFMPKNRMNLDYMNKRFKGLGRSRIYLQAYQYCIHNNNLPDTNLSWPFWKDKLAFRIKEKRKRWLSLIFMPEGPKKRKRKLEYLALIGEINEIKNLKDSYIKIYSSLFELKAKIKHLQNEKADN